MDNPQPMSENVGTVVSELKFEGIHTCNNRFNIDCNHKYNWMVHIANNESNRSYDVETYDKTLGRVINKEGEHYTISAICPKCHQDNIIEHQE